MTLLCEANRSALIPKRFVLLSIPIVARRDDFVGQVVNLRPIVNRPSGGNRNSGDTPAPFAPRRYVGQVGRGTLWVRPIVNRPFWAMPLCGAANPGCSRLSGGLLRPRTPWFPSPKRPSAARVSPSWFARVTHPGNSRTGRRRCVVTQLQACSHECEYGTHVPRGRPVRHI